MSCKWCNGEWCERYTITRFEDLKVGDSFAFHGGVNVYKKVTPNKFANTSDCPPNPPGHWEPYSLSDNVIIKKYFCEPWSPSEFLEVVGQEYEKDMLFR